MEMGHQEKDNSVLHEYAKAVIQWMTEGDKCCLLLVGDVGCGKTTMLNAICRMVNDLYYSNISYERRGFQWESSFVLSSWAQTNTERYEEFKRREWVAIDDFGQEAVECMSYGNIIYPIRDILLHRYDNNLITILTTNLPPKAITEKYGRRIGDRLAEMANIIKFNEKSYRQ